MGEAADGVEGRGREDWDGCKSRVVTRYKDVGYG